MVILFIFVLSGFTIFLIASLIYVAVEETKMTVKKTESVAFQNKDSVIKRNDVFYVGDILIVGDWFVDEYWFVVRHHSEISSHTRPVHYRIISRPDEIVRDLCGGGLITRVLYELRKYKSDKTKNTIKEQQTAIYDQYKEQFDQLKEGVFRLQEWLKINENIEEINKINNINEIEKIEDPERKIEKGHGPAFSERDKQYKLFGLGRWHPNDDKFLPHFIHARCRTEGTVGNALFSIMLPDDFCDREIDDTKLINLEKVPSNASTIRCIRAYKFVSGRFEQLHRIDWEQAPSQNKQKEENDREVVKGLFSENGEKIKLVAAIVDDHTKGVINKNLIKEIIDTSSQNPKWFVRTKDNRIQQANRANWPDWLSEIKSIELLVVGPENSCRSYPANSLLTKKRDRLTKHAYELIDMLVGEKDPDQRQVKNVVLTSDNLEVVVLLGEFCFIAKPQGKIENIELEKINWTTAFYAAFVYEMLNPEKERWEKDEKSIKDMINWAIKNAHEHSGVRIPKVLQEPTDKSCHEPPLDSASRSGKSVETEVKKVCNWKKMRNDWGMAVSDHGIIDRDENNQPIEKRLEIWRSSTDLPGYIVCIKEKREAIRRIWKKINSFILCEQPPQSLSILLEADPAFGKSFLVKKLAEISNCTLEQCDITQMIERRELLDLFDRVADAQARSSGPVFVFVDEINASLDGSPVYGAFLSPLESGNYIRNGQRIELKPCIWMFAGTPNGDSRTDDKDNQKKEKRKDFESRMTMIERIDYESIREKRITGRSKLDVENEARLEQVYMGTMRINEAFNDVNRIDINILKVFHALKPENAPARLIKRLANSLENVQYGRVHKGNCTSLEWQELIKEKDKFLDVTGDFIREWNEPFDPSKVIEYVDINLS